MWFSVKLWMCKGENNSNNNTQIKEGGANLGLDFGGIFTLNIGVIMEDKYICQ